jgi:nuclear pore complex protein Nup98-Nup96
VPELGGLLVEPDLWSLDQVELARVHELQVSRDGVGAVTFHGITDCRGLVGKRKLSDIVVLSPGEVIVYPNQSMKPPVGSGLNKPASIVLYGCLPKAQVFIDKKARERYKKRVRQMTEDKGAEFIGYDCDEGIWQFRVQHF